MAKFIITGLGNPGEEYANTRHNTGAMALETLRKKWKFPDWSEDKKNKALVTEGALSSAKKNVILIFPQTMMNLSGKAIKPFVLSEKAAENLAVIYDDLDLPLGALKISYGRGSGGHKGLESVIKNIKTKNFVRFRIGISPVTRSGKIAKPKGEDRVLKFILTKFTAKEHAILKKPFDKVMRAAELFIKEGRGKTMNEFN